MRTASGFLILFLSFLSFISAAKPSAEVDSAIRDRIRSFYQLQTQKKFRQAEEFVAADTRDLYYDSQKTEIRDFQIIKIEYSSDFQQATVTLKAKRMALIPGVPPFEVESIFTSDWKIDNGKWCWYVDQNKPIETPFGKIYPQKVTPNGTSGASIAEQMAKLSGNVSAATLAEAVHPSADRIHFDPNHPTPQTVTLTNTMPGPVSIKPLEIPSDFQVTIAKADLAAKQSTTVIIAPAAGAHPHPDKLLLKVLPAGTTIKIDIDYGAK